jgi:chromosome partitioning protein
MIAPPIDQRTASLDGNLVSGVSLSQSGPCIDMQRITALAGRAAALVSVIRGRLLMPDARKVAPVFKASRVAEICGIALESMAESFELPPGRVLRKGGWPEFSLVETQVWARALRASSMRPAECRAATVAVGNFKGGVGKTTTSMVLAQGLSMRGHRVLVIDTDPQGSLTTLFGILPETEVREDMTVGPIYRGDSIDITSAVQKTYWTGVDLVPAAPFLFSAEFSLPTMQLKNPSAKFWNVLNASLERVRHEYDVIIIDTPPALSYVAINAFMAADGIVVPMPPSALDFASAAQFWGLFADLGNILEPGSTHRKAFEFLHILLSRVDQSDAAVPAVRQWIKATYGNYVLPVEIPKTTVTSSRAAEFGTVYDVQKYEGAAKTYRRALEAYDSAVEHVELSIVAAWRRKRGLSHMRHSAPDARADSQ